MVAFVKGIFYDLSGRIQKMLVDLGQRQIDSEVPKPFFQKTLALLSELSQDVNTILVSPDLAFEEFAENHISKFNTLHERFLAIELYRYQAIVRFGHGGEKYFNALIARIYEEIDCDQLAPLVAGISNSDNYYWVYPTYEIIALPIGEDQNLLNLPDIFHEIAHLLCSQHLRSFKGEGKINRALDQHFDTEIKSILDENRGKERITELRKAYEHWKNSWIEEFICDMVGTYLSGPAYGWTNFKICTLSSSDKGIFSFSAEHPSDETRMYALVSMLSKMDYKSEIELLKRSWAKFLSICTNSRSPLYQLFLPRHLIDELTDSVFDACRNIGLNSCCQQAENGRTPISKLLNQAWNESLNRPENFSEWERRQIESIKNALFK